MNSKTTSEMSSGESSARLRWGVNLSQAALVIVEKLGTGKAVLLYHPALPCELIERGEGWKVSASAARLLVDRMAVDELRATGVISPLSQYGYSCKCGWREIVGSLGEHYDIYLCTQ